MSESLNIHAAAQWEFSYERSFAPNKEARLPPAFGKEKAAGLKAGGLVYREASRLG
jgi:hypothetical protein